MMQATQTPGQHRFLTVPEVASELRLTYHGVLGLIRAGKLPARKVGKVYRIPRDELEAHLQPPASVS